MLVAYLILFLHPPPLGWCIPAEVTGAVLELNWGKAIDVVNRLGNITVNQ